VQTTIVEDRDVSYLMIAQNDTANSTDTLKALLKADMGLPGTAAGITDPKTKLQLQAIDDITKDWAGAADAKLSPADKAAWVATNQRMLNNTLLAASPIFKTVLADIQAKLNLLPPSAAMAGVYTMVDNNRGVWKAPANVSLAGVVRPAVSISAEDQEDLNVTTQGKSINAIRAFVGEGVLVWGARTLDGNSLDWRYINVRRTMIMLEESCRLAAKAMVFEPNVANTWVTIKSMLQNFLTGIWKRGGLAGTVPEDAFSVHVGLGETMTPDDILEGILRVTVLVAVSRPAEFIEITFQQQMQKS
jgi:phage tail sheath protein FI